MPNQLTKIPLRDPNSQFTDDQWQAIYDSGANILVSASAGSGKTTVLVKRVIEKIEARVNVDELLIVTYTEAAAKEMKQRIQDAVQEKITSEIDDETKRHFVHQLSLIPTASISTLHSFCLQVIRKYYYLIDIDPVFRLLTDETEMLLLKEDVWDDVRSELYESESELFYDLTENFSNDRSDDGLTRLIFSLYDFARANPNPKEWLDSLAEGYRVTGELAETPIYQTILKPRVVSEVKQMIHNAKEMLALSETDERFEKVYKKMLEEAAMYEMLEELVMTDQLGNLHEYLKTIEFGRYPTLTKLEPAEKELNNQIKALRDANKKAVVSWQEGLFSLSPEVMKEVMAKSEKMVTYMAEVAYKFEQAYAARKLEKNLVDFNDLEHFTLQILAKQIKGQWEGTEASTYYRDLFSEVLVDEYQDINKLQESILYWLRQPNDEDGNLFMVGDVKQSIYSFRLADPQLFIEKYERYEESDEGRRIILAENFRSRREVLDFTNLIFQQLMNKSVGQLEYDEPARLVNGFTGFPEDERMVPELLIFENENEETTFGDEESSEPVEDVSDTFQIDDKTEGEIRLVGNKIKEMMANGMTVYNKKTKEPRALKYSDIVLLSPTKKNNLVLLDIFKELGIPLQVNDTQNYFQATEIKIMVSLLNVIDNPYQDIPLASVLRSPIVGIKENDLARIRINYPKGSFYDGVEAYLEEDKADNPELVEKLRVFYNQLQDWRELARRDQLVQLIWRVYQDTGFLDYVGGMPAGKQRQANLHALYERATSYEEMSFKGLFQFVRFIEKMQAKDKDLAEPTDLSENEDAVRVMTIHGSKGLEFPVVFVLDLTRRFNLMDLNQSYLFDVDLGAGVKYTDNEERLVYRTFPYLAIREEKRKQLLSEEMRKLYVALTRAEEKLFLVGSYKSKEEAIKKWSIGADEPNVVLGDGVRLKNQNLMNWIGMTLMRHRDMEEYQTEYGFTKLETVYNHPGRFKITFSNLEDLRAASQGEVKVDSGLLVESEKQGAKRAEPELVKQARFNLAYEYLYEQATKTTSYQSVSEIKRVFEDPDNSQLLTLDLTTEEAKTVGRYVENELAKPAFLKEETKPSAAEVGTATHLVMQLIPLNTVPDEQIIQSILDDLVANQVLTEVLAASVSIESIVSFFQSEFGQKIIKNSETVYREQPFSMLLRAEEVFKDYPKAAGDQLLVHGIIDGYLETEDELILYDFKTDHLKDASSEAELDRLVKKYRGQISLYERALALTKNKPVTQSKLILLSSDQVIDVY